MLRQGRAILLAATIAATAVGLVAVASGVAHAKPNHVTVTVDGCVVRVNAKAFDPDVEMVEWSIYRTGTSAVLRSGAIAVGANGKGSNTVSPVLGAGKYRLVWSYSWRGQSTRDGEAFFTVQSCGGQSTPTSPTPTPSASTSSATASASPSESSTPGALVLPTDALTPSFGDESVSGVTVRSTRTAGESEMLTAVIAALAAFTLASGGTAAYIASRRPPPDPRRHRATQAGPNLRFSGSSAPER